MLSASHWLLAQARFCGRTYLPPSSNSITSTGQGDIPISSTGCTCLNIHRIHSTCGHGNILAITSLILFLSGCSCLNIHWYTAPEDMMTFRWSCRSYQFICQQHPPYSHSQVMLIYYNNDRIWVINDFLKISFSPQKHSIIHYSRYVFEMLKFPSFLNLTFL